MKKYSVREEIPKNVAENLKSYPPLTQNLLFSRSISKSEDADIFLNPDYKNHLNDPYLLKDMDKAVDRILSAMEKNEKIAIYSDYDADGIPGAVVMHDFLKKIGYKNFVNYIPLRNEEGFGLNHEAIDSLAGEDVKLLITIDCGISDVEQVETAKKHGIDVIITDHHLPPTSPTGKRQNIPKAFAVINPKQKGCDYPEKMLCGSGVIFKFVQAVITKFQGEALKGKVNFPEGYEKWFLDMVGLATLSDMVPLLGENRVLAYYGLKVLQKSPRVGLNKLFSILRIDKRFATEDDIAFMITPRINAASRMGIPLDAFKLLSTTDEVEAGVLAEHLNKKNDERKGVVAAMVKEIKSKIKDRSEEMKKVLVMGNPDWKPSLLGLVANSFSDEHCRPVFLWGRPADAESMADKEGGNILKGSCRSGNGIDVFKLMEKAKDAFLEYGGHQGAGGFSVSQDKIHTLEDSLNKAYFLLEKEMTRDGGATLVDKKLSIDDVSWNLWNEVEKFAPFGFENPKPLFLFENIKIEGSKQFGKEKNHLELKFSTSSAGKKVIAIAFFSSPEKFKMSLSEGDKINLVATLEKSNFKNYPELRLRIVDIF